MSLLHFVTKNHRVVHIEDAERKVMICKSLLEIDGLTLFADTLHEA